ncbi:uncharacterized protein LOC111354825 [Spodoptera litura]|uniref:Uncharacterized protein LOC111354825 n=1 Tax=Spodoptera litura TaxID=69820 RepID=A0A9J7E9X6_SPOLT|nr:uncharacterized protein LOC111354825 [Spodoptera litura]
MNNKKCVGSNNGWLLCESKSFPGKLYYFNVRNGDAVWTSNDSDTTIKKNNSFAENILDKSHKYPEPTTLPDDHPIAYHKIGTNIKPEILTNTPSTHLQQPIFGQPAYPLCTPNRDTKITKVFWMPVQVPMPVCWNVESNKPMSDKITQTFEWQQGQQDILVQSCKVPLSKRFVNNQRNVKSTNFETSTPIMISQTSKPFDESPPTVFEPKSPDIMKSKGKPVFVFGDKFENANSEIEEVLEKQDVLKNLDSNDLRFHLLAKRKKSVDQIFETAVEKNKPKTDTEVPTCKKVTFDLVDDVTDETSSDLPPDDFIPPSNTQSASTTNLDKPAPKLNTLWFKDIQTSKEPNFLENAQMFKNKKIWFMAVDTEVLLLDYEAIKNYVKADPTCKLLIPHVVQADIEAICLGTCDGQQRVLNARQITRNMAIPPPYFLVEPPHNEDCFEMTTESILNCCMKAIKNNYYVVLITNDPHLKNRASILNIPSYKLNEIKNGALVKPYLTDVTVKSSRQNDDTDKRNEFEKNSFNVGSVKQQLFMDNDDLVGFDRLIDITKPKYLKDCDYRSDSESIGSDISRDVQNLNLKDNILSKSEHVHRNPFLPQNGRNKLIPTVFDSTNLKKTVQNSKFDFGKRSIWNFGMQKKEQESLFNSNPASHTKKTISNSIFDEIRNPFLPKTDTIKKVTPNSKFDFEKPSNPWNFDIQMKERDMLPSSNFKTMEIFGKQVTTTTQQSSQKNENSFEINKLKVKTSSQQRIKKILEHVSLKTDTDNTGTFKIPQPLQFKNRTRIGCIESPLKNSKFGNCLSLNLESLDENLKRFCVRSKSVGDRISTKIDEFLCIYIQVMEDVLNDLLKKNTIKDVLPPTTLQETLNCVKMVYNEYENIREIIYRLILYIEKCVNDKGHIIKSMKPDDFMKMFGCGVMLISALQSIFPSSEELKDTEVYLSSLLTSIESDCEASIEDLLKTPPVYRSDCDEKYEFRPNFIKQPSYVLEYLKKHFTEWTSYDEDIDSPHVNNSDVKILRTVGKNLNLLKIDKNKSISMTQNATEADLLKNNSQIFSFTGNNEPKRKDFGKSTEIVNEDKNKHKDSQITKKIDNNTLAATSKTDALKVIRSGKLIDEYEKKVRQPVDLDLLDYSEIYEPSLDGNFEDDSVKETEGSFCSKNNENQIEENKIIDASNINDNDIIENCESYYHDTKNNNQNAKTIEKPDFEAESETFTDKFDESGVFNDVSDVNNDVSIRNDNDGCDKDDVTNDSGFENESTCAHITVKLFFNELSTTFKAVSKFVTSFSEEIQRRGLNDKIRNDHLHKATKCLENLGAITLRLKSIIKREAAEVTVLKTLLLKAGLEATSDKRVTRYRQIVLKCLQQSLILENALKIIISTTAGDVDGVSCSMESIHSRYFNIFDNKL